MLDLSIIIVNWNTRDALLDCLASIVNNLKTVSYEVVVVDNASIDGSAEAIAEKYPSIRIIRNDRNLGFARATNQAIKSAKGRYYLSLNSDAEITAGSLETMVRFMDETPAVGIAGAQLIKPKVATAPVPGSRPENPSGSEGSREGDGTLQNSFDNFPDMASSLFNKNILRLAFPKWYPSKDNITPQDKPFEVESIIGACMLIRPLALRQTGLFDENYFIFLEETDLCLQMRHLGWKVMVVPSAKVYHRQGETKKQFLIPAKIEYLNSLYKFFCKNKSGLVYWGLRIIYPLRLLVQLVFTALGCLVTLCLIRKVRMKCYWYACLLFWHILLCPEEMTLKGIIEKAKQEPLYAVINWVFKDMYLDDSDLPKKLSRNPVPHPLRDPVSRDGMVATKGTATGLPKTAAASDHLPYEWTGEFKVLKNTRVKKLLRLIAPSGQKYLMKMYRDIHPFCWLKNLISGNKAERELTIGRKISYLGIPTVVPAAIGDNRKITGVPRYNIVVTKELENCCGLNIYLAKPHFVSHLPHNQRVRRDVIKTWGQLAAKIHQRGILQDDFDPNNILIQFNPDTDPVPHPSRDPVSRDGIVATKGTTTRLPKTAAASEQFHLFLVDFERVKLYRKLTLVRQIQSLAKLNRIQNGVTNSDRLIFLRVYLNTDNKTIIRTWIKQIKEMQETRREADYQWVKKVSLLTSRHIGRYRTRSYSALYRKKYPANLRDGYNENQIEDMVSRIIKKEDSGLDITAKSFDSYRDAKKLWQNLNALLRVYITPALPVALIKIKKGSIKGMVIYKPIKANRYISSLFYSPKMQERLTELENVGIKPLN